MHLGSFGHAGASSRENSVTKSKTVDWHTVLSGPQLIPLILLLFIGDGNVVHKSAYIVLLYTVAALAIFFGSFLYPVLGAIFVIIALGRKVYNILNYWQLQDFD